MKVFGISQVLARKWRPQTFADVVGQGHVLRALSHALDHDRLHHAYLFAGTRGVGKTTLARILAKALNCERGVSSTPCGDCSACAEIDAGRFIDLIEVDAASRTKVDDTRELLDNVQYAATRGRFKVYLIDEVHMLSTHSFNALLKTLEEPPDHVKFLLATTDPQKLPVTVLSRCLQFNLLRLTQTEIADRLAHIAQAEGIDAERSALNLLARAADGSLRDALSLTDQAIAFGDGALPESAVAEMLGTLSDDTVTSVLRALADHNADALMQLIAELDQRVPNYAQLLDAIAESLSKLAVWHVLQSVEDEADTDLYESLASAISPEDTQLWYQIALHGKRDLPLAPQPRIGAEMTLLRMLAFRPERGSSEASFADAKSTSSPTAAKSAAQPAAKPMANQAAPAVAETRQAASVPTDVVEVDGDDGSLADTWHRIVHKLELKGMVRLLAANCALESRDGDALTLSLDKRSESLLSDVRVKDLGKALANYFGSSIDVTVKVDGVTAGHSPAQREARAKEQAQQDARESLERDAGLVEAQKLFDVTLDADSIQIDGMNQAAGSRSNNGAQS
ncbi:MAG: DNA polymerase III subunit gamma/tau [Pseudomonadota bacterium]